MFHSDEQLMLNNLSGFLWALWFPPPIKLPRYNWKYYWMWC